jgi:hypothetical protein
VHSAAEGDDRPRTSSLERAIRERKTFFRMMPTMRPRAAGEIHNE